MSEAENLYGEEHVRRYRETAGDVGLYCLDAVTGAVRCIPTGTRTCRRTRTSTAGARRGAPGACADS